MVKCKSSLTLYRQHGSRIIQSPERCQEHCQTKMWFSCSFFEGTRIIIIIIIIYVQLPLKWRLYSVVSFLQHRFRVCIHRARELTYTSDGSLQTSGNQGIHQQQEAHVLVNLHSVPVLKRRNCCNTLLFLYFVCTKAFV